MNPNGKDYVYNLIITHWHCLVNSKPTAVITLMVKSEVKSQI